MSVDISREQYLLLKKFCKNNASVESLDSEQLSDCNYLVKCGYLKAIKELKSYEQTVCGVRPIAAIASLTTTASGRAAIYSFKATPSAVFRDPESSVDHSAVTPDNNRE